MRSSQEIIEILEQTYPKSMNKTFNKQEDAVKYIQRKCSNFEKIFEGICSEGMGIDAREWGRESVRYRIRTSDKYVVFEFVIQLRDKKYECSFNWRLLA